VRATLDHPDADAAVVAAPPHPQMGGDREDRRLEAVGEAMADRGVATLRMDYGPWDEGRGERTDVGAALRWAADRYEAVGLFGYSFGAAMALGTAAERDGLAAVSVLAPPSEAAGDVTAVEAPLQVLYGERDDTVDSGPVVDVARERAAAGAEVTVVALSADHHFVGQHEKVGERVAAFLRERLGAG
jgi:alpha/beta superfamily hydrolase